MNKSSASLGSSVIEDVIKSHGGTTTESSDCLFLEFSGALNAMNAGPAKALVHQLCLPKVLKMAAGYSLIVGSQVSKPAAWRNAY